MIDFSKSNKDTKAFHHEHTEESYVAQHRVLATEHHSTWNEQDLCLDLDFLYFKLRNVSLVETFHSVFL